MKAALLEQIDQLLPLLAEGKTFGTRRARSAVREALVAAERILRPKVPTSLVREAEKAYTDVKANFEAVLLGHLADFEDGRIEKGQFGFRVKDAIRDHYERAYLLGLRFGGSATRLEPEDLVFLKGARQQEFTYLNRFIDAVEGGTSQMAPVDRMRMYVNTLDGIFHSGTTEAQDDTTEIDWALGVAEHCPDCLTLAAGGPYTKATLPTTPRAGDTRCLSNCKCRLIYRPGAITPVPVVKEARGGAPPEERIPEGLRQPTEGERVFLENLMAQIWFARTLIPRLTGQTRQAQILARKGLADRLLDFAEERQLWVRPTWAAGNRAIGEAVHRETLEELLRGRALSPADLRKLRQISRGRFDEILDRFEASIASREVLRKVTAGARAQADELERVAGIALAVGLVGLAGKEGEEEPAPPEEEPEEVQEDVTTTADIAPFPRKSLPTRKDLAKARFAVGQKFRFAGSPFVWRIESVAAEAGSKAVVYGLQDVENPERQRTATEDELEAAELVEGIAEELRAVLTGTGTLCAVVQAAMVQEGGPGSGHWAHQGRPKLRGGSKPGGGRGKLPPLGVHGVSGPAEARVDALHDTFVAGGMPSADAWKVSRERITNEVLREHGVTLSHVRRGFSVDHEQYEVHDLKVQLATAADRPPSLRIAGAIREKSSGKSVGIFGRQLDLETGEAHHESFFLEKSAQGKGIAASLSKNQFALYRKMGLEEVTLTANGDVGKYAWALQGFDFARPNIAEAFITGLRLEVFGKLMEGRLGGQAEMRTLTMKLTKNVRTSWDVARFRLNGEKIGKAFLLKAGAWDGVLRLDPKAPSQTVFKSYLKVAKPKLKG